MKFRIVLLLLCMTLSAIPVSAQDRVAKWSFATGDYIVASPALYDGMVFAGSANGNLYAINATDGKELWRYGKVGRIESSPAVSRNMVFFGSNDNSFYALWLNGTLAWSFKTGDKVLSSPAFAYGVVYFASTDGKLYASEAADGRMLWNYTTYAGFSSSPLVSDWVTYISSDEGRLYAFNAFNGTKLWEQRFPAKIQSGFAISPQNVLYFPCKDGNVYAVFAGDGSRIWNISTGTEAQSSVYYSNETGMIYFGTTDDNLYAADTNGRMLWKYETGNWVISTPKLRGGLLYVGSYDGRLYAISIIRTGFSSESINVSDSPSVIKGSSDADAGVEYVQVRVEGGDWQNVTGTSSWSYSWDTSSLEHGDYTFEARSIDKAGNIELPTYARAIVHFTSKPQPKGLVVSFPAEVMVGLPIKFQVNDTEGNPVPHAQVVIFGKTYTADENGVVDKDENGIFIKSDKDGEFNFTVSKEGYLPPKGVLKIKVLKITEMPPYMLAAAVIVVVITPILGYLLLKKLRRKKQ